MRPFYWKARKGWYLKTRGPDGKRKNVRLADTKQRAFDIWKASLRQSDANAGIGSQLVIDLFAQFTESIIAKAGRGEVTRQRAERVRDFVVDFSTTISESLTIADLKPGHVYEWLERRSDKWNQTSRHDAAAAVKQATRWLVHMDKITRDPIAGVSVRRGQSRKFIVDEATWLRLWNGWSQVKRSTHAFRAYMLGLKLSGCRPSELIEMRIEFIEADGTWTLRDHKTASKTGRVRKVYPSPCLATLVRMLANGRTSGHVWRRADGQPWTYAIVRRSFHRLRERAGVSEDFVPYSFRHTWITDALVAGVEVATVAEMAGTSIQMINKHYGHLASHRNFMIEAARQVAVNRNAQ